MKVRVHPAHGAPRPHAGVYTRGMGSPRTDFALGHLLGLATGMGRVPRPARRFGRRGMGCSDAMAENNGSDASIPCVYGDTQAPTPAKTPGNQPSSGGGYEPVDTLQTWLYNNVVTPAAGSPTGQYPDPTLMAQMLQQAAQQYCQGVSYGGPNNPCAGADTASIVKSLTGTYSAQVAAKGGQPTVNSGNAPGYIYTQFAPGYNSGGPGYILLPNGQSVPNTAQNLSLASSMYAQQQGAAVLNDLGGPAPTIGTNPGASTPTSGPAPTAVNAGGGVPSASAASSFTSFLNNLLPSTTNTPAPAAAGSVDLSFLTDSSMVGGIPNWAVLAGAAGVLWMLSGKK